MKLEVGKCYRTRDGRKVGPMTHHGSHNQFFEFDGELWFPQGSFYHDIESKHDIIDKWVDDEYIERTKRMIEVMQAYVDGKEIIRTYNNVTIESNYEPEWNWLAYDYRIAKLKIQDSINWDHIAPEFICHARDIDGSVRIFENKPEVSNAVWYHEEGKSRVVNFLTSFKQGTVSWEDSLVMRPGYESHC